MISLSLTMLGVAFSDNWSPTPTSFGLMFSGLVYGLIGLSLGLLLWKRPATQVWSNELLIGNWCVLWLNTIARIDTDQASTHIALSAMILVACGWCVHTHMRFWCLTTLAVAVGMVLLPVQSGVAFLTGWLWLWPLGMIFGWRILTSRLAVHQRWSELEEKQLQNNVAMKTMLSSFQMKEEQFRILSDQVPVGVFQTDEAGVLIYTNTAWRRITGTTALEAEETDWTNFLHPEERAIVRLEWHESLQNGDPYDRECRLGNEPANQRWIQVHSCPNYSDNGITFVGVVQEITQRRKAAEAMQRHAETLQAAQENEARQARHLSEVVAQLQEAKREAIQGTRAKSEFLANMSHEIRTPMTAVLGYTDMLLEQTANQPVLQEQLQTIKRNSEYLLEIINDILDLSKVEAGKLEIEQIRCSPRHVVQDVISLMQVRANSKGLQLRKVFDGPFPMSMEADPTRLRQIVLNLLSNALKFTSSGSVTVRLGYEAPSASTSNTGRIRLTVEDTGMGMTSEQLARLFRPFTQADSTTTRQFGGTGLGLTICKRFAELMGGDIFVQSTAGVGSAFTVVLPAHAAMNIVSIVEPTETVPTPVAPTLATPSPAPVEPAPPRPASEIALPYRILVAEDGPDNQRLIQFILKKAGAQVQIVENGQLAIDAVEAAVKEDRQFDAVLMDMSMPVLDGYGAARELRTRGHRLPIIALTAHAMSSDRDKCLAAGCNDYATKPLNRPVLLDIIQRYVLSSTSCAVPASAATAMTSA